MAKNYRIQADDVDEETEYVSLVLREAEGANLGSDLREVARLNILDNTQEPVIRFANEQGEMHREDMGQIDIEVRLSTPSEREVSVH